MPSSPVVDDRVHAAMSRALELGELGIQVAVYLGSSLIVDASAGMTDINGCPVDGDTLFPVLSVSKAISLTAVHLQAERGLIDYRRPVSAYWPNFAGNGKDAITVAHVLAHQSGIPQMPPGATPETMCDWNWMVREIEALAPVFQPGSANGYQSIIYGWLLGELVCRTDPQRRTFGRFVQDELCRPLGIEHLWLGMPADNAIPVAKLVSPRVRQIENESEVSRAAKPPGLDIGPPLYNRSDILQACLPSTGAVMNARSGARLFAMIANGGELDGVRLLSEKRIRSFTALRPRGGEYDQVLLGGGRIAPPIGVGGYWLGGSPMGGGEAVLSHGGGSTSSVWLNLDRRLTVVICQNLCFADRSPVEEHPFSALARVINDLAAECGRVGDRRRP